MKKILLMFVCFSKRILLSLIVLFPLLTFATGESCFPIGRSIYDRECYNLETPKECQSTKDKYSCGWGKRKKSPIPDDEQMVCDTSRCSDFEDGDHDTED